MYKLHSRPIRLFLTPKSTRPSFNYSGVSPCRLDRFLRSSLPLQRRLLSSQQGYWVPTVTQRSYLKCRATTQTEDNEVMEITEETKEDDGFFGKLRRLLRDVGMGRRSFWEGGVGAFLVIGAGVCVWTVLWVRGTQLNQGKPYTVRSHSFYTSHSSILRSLSHFHKLLVSLWVHQLE